MGAGTQPEQPAAGRPSRPRTRDLILAALFTVGWLLPVAVSSWRGGPPSSWPTRARDFYSVSCLFGTASDRVSMFYVQVRREGLAGWQDFDEGEYFRLEPFGHRTRFDRFMARFGIGDADRSWMLELWAQNLTDEEYIQVAFDAPLQTGSWNAFLAPPRTYGATLRMWF